MTNQLFDVVRTTFTDTGEHKETLYRGKTERAAEAIVNMASIRRYDTGEIWSTVPSVADQP